MRPHRQPQTTRLERVLNVFVILMAYYTLKTVREALILGEGTAELVTVFFVICPLVFYLLAQLGVPLALILACRVGRYYKTLTASSTTAGSAAA